MSPMESDRRTFLARLGLFGIVAGAAVALPVGARAGQLGLNVSNPLMDVLRKALTEVSRDTYNAMVAFAVPGTDVYSREQGTPRSEAGAIDAKAAEFMLHALDNFVPFPDELLRPVQSGLAAGLQDVPLVLPGGVLGIDTSGIDSLGAAIDKMLANDEVLPLSVTVTLLLNLLALQVTRDMPAGELKSPFGRLTYAQKAAVFSLLEDADADLINTFDANVPDPLRGSVSGFCKYLGGSLIGFSTFATYSEWSVFDSQARSVRSEPVGWTISDYDPGTLHGWDDLQGYYQNRKAVTADA